MPIYEYECRKCRERFERIQKFSDPHATHCPKCGGEVEQVITAAAVQFKGSGWYVTDYARKGSNASSASKPDSGDAKSGSGDTKKSESSSDKPAGKDSGKNKT